MDVRDRLAQRVDHHALSPARRPQRLQAPDHRADRGNESDRPPLVETACSDRMRRRLLGPPVAASRPRRPPTTVSSSSGERISLSAQLEHRQQRGPRAEVESLLDPAYPVTTQGHKPRRARVTAPRPDAYPAQSEAGRLQAVVRGSTLPRSAAAATLLRNDFVPVPRRWNLGGELFGGFTANG